MGRPVSFANCSLMCLVGFGVDEKAVFRISNCFAFMVVRGPRRFEPAPPSPLPPPAPPSGLLFSVWLSLVSGSPSREPSTDQSRAAASLSYNHRHRHHLRLIKFAELLRQAPAKLAPLREKLVSVAIASFADMPIDFKHNGNSQRDEDITFLRVTLFAFCFVKLLNPVAYYTHTCIHN